MDLFYIYFNALASYVFNCLSEPLDIESKKSYKWTIK